MVDARAWRRGVAFLFLRSHCTTPTAHRGRPHNDGVTHHPDCLDSSPPTAVTQPNTPPIAGHSCLVPVTSLTSELKALYVFVEIGVDAQHLVASLRANLEGG